MNALNSPSFFDRKPNTISIDQYSTVQAVAAITRYNTQYLRRLLRIGKLEGIKVGSVWLIRLASLEAYLERMRTSGDRRCGSKLPVHKRKRPPYTNENRSKKGGRS